MSAGGEEDVGVRYGGCGLKVRHPGGDAASQERRSPGGEFRRSLKCLSLMSCRRDRRGLIRSHPRGLLQTVEELFLVLVAELRDAFLPLGGPGSEIENGADLPVGWKRRSTGEEDERDQDEA